MVSGSDVNFEAAADGMLAAYARDGVPGAFDRLSERYASVLKMRALRYSNVIGTDTEDFVQEGMLALFRAVKSFDPEVGAQFKTYAMACINNAMASVVKKHLKSAEQSGISFDIIDDERLAEGAPQGSAAMPAEDIYIEREDSALLAVQIQSLLSNFERQVLKLYLRGHSYLQIAELLSTSAKAVDNALQRVRRKLRPDFQGRAK